MSHTMDCLICFCPIKGPFIKCCDPQCLAGTCTDCGVALVAYSSQNNLMPTCPSKNCRGFYLISEIKKLSEPSISLYEKTCLQHILKDKGESVSMTIAHQDMLSKLRQERSVFIQQNFPLAISHVAAIAFKPRLSHLNRAKTQSLAGKLKSANRLCMNLYCNGRLDDNFTCMTCLTQFCTKCEQPLSSIASTTSATSTTLPTTTPTHICKQEDVESVQMIKKMIQCPNCKYPVEKSQGCNMMTCTHCGTNFDYATGAQTLHGNNHNAPITVREKYKLSVLLGKEISPDVLDIILDIESYEPSYSEKSLLNTVKAHLLHAKNTQNTPTPQEGEGNNPSDEKVIAKKITKQFEDMIVHKYQMKLYLSIHKEIENLHQQKALTVFELAKLRNKLVTHPLLMSKSVVSASTITTTITEIIDTTGPPKIKIKKIISKVI